MAKDLNSRHLYSDVSTFWILSKIVQMSHHVSKVPSFSWSGRHWHRASQALQNKIRIRHMYDPNTRRSNTGKVGIPGLISPVFECFLWSENWTKKSVIWVTELSTKSYIFLFCFCLTNPALGKYCFITVDANCKIFASKVNE